MSGTRSLPALAAFDEPAHLVCGIGNLGRQDDGIGWALIDWLEAETITPRGRAVRRYQLAVEDADLISRMERVLFVDATKDESIDDYLIEKVEPRMDLTFTSHSVSVPTIVATGQKCFGRTPEVYFLQIRGYEWDLGEGLSPRAQRNLDRATQALLSGPA